MQCEKRTYVEKKMLVDSLNEQKELELVSFRFVLYYLRVFYL